MLSLNVPFSTAARYAVLGLLADIFRPSPCDDRAESREQEPVLGILTRVRDVTLYRCKFLPKQGVQ